MGGLGNGSKWVILVWIEITRNTLCLYRLPVFNNTFYLFAGEDSDYMSHDFCWCLTGYLSYRFKVMPMNESSKKVLKVYNIYVTKHLL